MRGAHADASWKCPVCGTGLAEKRFNGIHVHHCTSCGGLWAQKSRLGEVLQHYMKFIAKRHDERCGVRARANPWEVEPAGRACPQCARPMKKLNYAYNSNVVVDVCEQCRGVWFDRGEMESIAEFFKNCGMPEKLKQEFEEIKTIYDHHELGEAFEVFADAVRWIVSFML